MHGIKEGIFLDSPIPGEAVKDEGFLDEEENLKSKDEGLL